MHCTESLWETLPHTPKPDAIHLYGISHTSEASQVREPLEPRPGGGTEFSSRRCKFPPRQSHVKDASWLEQVLVGFAFPGASLEK